MRRLTTLLTIVGILLVWPAIAYAQDPTPPPDDDITLPTATATQIGGPTGTPVPTPTNTPVQAEIIGDPTRLRTGPSLNFDIVTELNPGVTLPIVGQWLGFDWLLVRWEGQDVWVYANLVIVQGDRTTIPIVTPPPEPTENPAIVEAQGTSTAIVLTPGAAETATAASFFEFPATEVVVGTPAADAEAVASGPPTFTPPPPANQPDVVPLPTQEVSGGVVPPAGLIIGAVTFGTLMIVVGVIRRFF